jgi:hypothetical protein
MLRIPSNPELQSRLEQAAAAGLRKQSKLTSHYTTQLERQLSSGTSSLSPREKIQFLLLHRQFGGKAVPGLRAVVSAGRFVVGALRRLKGNA